MVGEVLAIVRFLWASLRVHLKVRRVWPRSTFVHEVFQQGCKNPYQLLIGHIADMLPFLRFIPTDGESRISW